MMQFTDNYPKNWKDLQDKVAILLYQAGYHTISPCKIETARGTVEVWKSMVPREVMEVEKHQDFKKDGLLNRRNKKFHALEKCRRRRNTMVDYATGIRTIICDEEWMVMLQ
ncbi:MAG: hypothetical protein PUG71_07560 [bacterium]|nr:hypothetical protein [bacterium]